MTNNVKPITVLQIGTIQNLDHLIQRTIENDIPKHHPGIPLVMEKRNHMVYYPKTTGDITSFTEGKLNVSERVVFLAAYSAHSDCLKLLDAASEQIYKKRTIVTIPSIILYVRGSEHAVEREVADLKNIRCGLFADTKTFNGLKLFNANGELDKRDSVLSCIGKHIQSPEPINHYLKDDLERLKSQRK